MNSTVSLSIQQKSLDDPISTEHKQQVPEVKSLFEYQQNRKFLKTNDEGGAIQVNATEQDQKQFKFNTAGLFKPLAPLTSSKGGNTDQQRGLSFKPPGASLQFSTSSPFNLPSAHQQNSTPVFTSGKSLFNIPNKSSASEEAKIQPSAKDNEEELDEPLQADLKETAQATDSSKLYQKQILKLKTLKGIGNEGNPSRKEQGFLSIEKSGSVNCLVFRSFLGANLFSGIINPKMSKVKEL